MQRQIYGWKLFDISHLFRHAYQQKVDLLNQEKAVVERKLNMLHADFKASTQVDYDHYTYFEK